MAEKIKLGNGQWGVKENGLLAYNDEDGIFKAIELQSSRASGATYVSESGLIADAEVGVPRIDWTNGVGELLLEPQSTNLISYSEDFTNVVWNKRGLTTVTKNLTAPDGSLNGYTLSFGRINVNDFYTLNLSVTNGVECNPSFYIKNVNSLTDNVNMRNGQTGPTDGDWDVDLSLVSSTEWERIDKNHPAVTVNNTFTSNGGIVGVQLYSDATDNTLIEIGIFGFQVEELSYPTSYIRTEGSQVTRIADAVTGNSSLGQVINSSEGVLYVEMSALADIDSIRLLELNDNNSTNRVYFYFRNSSGANPNRIFTFVVSGGSTVFNSVQTLPLSASVLDSNKFVIKWKLNDYSLWINGTEVDTGTGIAPLNLSRISFSDFVGNLPFYGRIRELKVYDTALTDAELTTLTTL